MLSSFLHSQICQIWSNIVLKHTPLQLMVMDFHKFSESKTAVMQGFAMISSL